MVKLHAADNAVYICTVGLQLHIIPEGLLDEYRGHVTDEHRRRFNSLEDNPLSNGTFSFYTSVSAVFSSKIEGEEIELDSFVKHKRGDGHYQPDYTRKTDDLYEAYQFAQRSPLNEGNVTKAHTLLTDHILQPAQPGKLRKGNMYVLTESGQIEYVAASVAEAKRAMQILYGDVARLCSAALSFEEVLFFASMIHLVFVKIHPYEDGNGRTARLLEKWFIAEKLGSMAWYLQTERHYYRQHQQYYSNIRALGLEYDSLDYSKALPFALMLPASL